MQRTASLVAILFLISTNAVTAQQPSPLTYVPPPPPLPATVIEPGPAVVAPSQPDGLFASAEVAFLYPDINFGLVNMMPLGPTGRFLHVPTVDLPMAVSPALELGYRAGCAGTFVLGYRFLAAEGNDLFTATTGEQFQVRTRLNTNVIDLDYGFVPLTAYGFDLSARLGGRIASVFFDSQASNNFAVQQASSKFFGGGIHGRLDIERRISLVPGLALFGRLDGAVLIGRVKQKFQLQAAGSNLVSAMTQRGQQTVPMAKVEAGLSFTPAALPGVKFTGGYQFEEYFSVGQIDGGPNGGAIQSRGEVSSHGWFIRAQVEF